MTAYNLSPGKSWVTGESVTATKMNTALTGSTTTITNNLIGQASSTTNYIPQWSDGSGALLKEGKELVTAPVDGSSTDDQIPTAQSVYESIDALPAIAGTTFTGTGVNNGAIVTVGSIKTASFTGASVAGGTGATQTYTITNAGFTSIYSVHISTEMDDSHDRNDAMWQIVTGYSTTSVTAVIQNMGFSGNNTRAHVIIVGT